MLCAGHGDIRGELVSQAVTIISAHWSQVLTGLQPFHHVMACTPVPAIMRGERPRKPLDAETLGFSRTLWKFVQSCWSESSLTRPTAQQLSDFLFSASLTWVPSPVYPAVVTDAPDATDTDLPSFSSTPPEILQGVGTTKSIGSLLVFIVRFLLCI